MRANITSPSRLSFVLSLIVLSGSHTCQAFQSSIGSWRQSSKPAGHFKPVPSVIPGSPRSSSSKNAASTTQLFVWKEALTVVSTFYRTSPYAAGALTCGAKACAADFVAQRRQMGTSDRETMGNFEMARNVAFLLYGAAYQGLAQEYVYNHCYAAWFGTTSHPMVVLQKVLFDLCVQTTLVTLPMAYLTKAAIFRYSFREGMRRYKNDIVKNGLLKKYFTLWGPVQCLTFSIVPEHLRISFIAAVSFFWLIILSTITGRKQEIVSPPQAVETVKTEKIIFDKPEPIHVLMTPMANATATA